MSDPPSASRRPQSSSSSTSSSYYDRLRSQTLDHAETPATRVEVNQRALIDKILARYASASAVYRELLQNSNDAGATVAEIHFTTAITSANSTATATTALFTTKQTTNHHHHDASNGNSSNNSAVVTQVVYRNNGMPFRDQDWDRLQKIAEGNPDVSKIGAFGVGAYTMFSITEEPVIVSGDTCLLFCWRGDSLYTKTAPYHHANNDNDENQWTTFVLPSRDVYPLPHWQEFGEFLTAALTFTGSLHQIKVTVNGHERLRLRKTILQPPRPIQTPSSSSSLTKTTVTNTTSAVTAFLWNSVFTNGGNSSGGGSSTSSHGRNNSFTTTTTLFALEQVQESLVRITVKVTADDSCDGSVAAAAASMDARYITATAKTNIAKEMAHRMERVTKKKPPPTVTVQVFLNYNEPTAHLVPISMPSSAASAAGATSGHHHYRHHVTSTTNKTHQEQQDMAVRIAQSFAPVLGQGRIFIGFRTSQTTGLAAHVAAPFVPTVEREAMDLHDAVLARFNTELLEFSGLVLRLALEHTMRNVIDVAWQAQRLEREALERQYAGQQQSQKNTIASLVENNGSAKKITLTTNTNKQEDDEDDSDEAGTSSTGFMTFARYMAR